MVKIGRLNQDNFQSCYTFDSFSFPFVHCFCQEQWFTASKKNWNMLYGMNFRCDVTEEIYSKE